MLVGAFACAHTPQLLARPATEDRDLVLRVHAAFARPAPHVLLQEIVGATDVVVEALAD